jgi:hypothetical protein
MVQLQTKRAQCVLINRGNKVIESVQVCCCSGHVYWRSDTKTISYVTDKPYKKTYSFFKKKGIKMYYFQEQWIFSLFTKTLILASRRVISLLINDNYLPKKRIGRGPLKSNFFRENEALLSKNNRFKRSICFAGEHLFMKTCFV